VLTTKEDKQGLCLC